MAHGPRWSMEEGVCGISSHLSVCKSVEGESWWSMVEIEAWGGIWGGGVGPWWTIMVYGPEGMRG